ncbi:MAG: 50S ribosomal protein L11 methyltransferase [Prevotella sp.]
MKYFVADFKINCTGELFDIARDLVISAAGDAQFEAFEENEGGVLAYIQKDLFDKVALDSALESVDMPGVDIHYIIEDVEDKNWNSNWEDNGFDPINIDGKCIVYDAKHTDRYALEKETLNILIEARQAFGTGTHQTTRLVIRELMRSNMKEKSLLDCGCGTGILSIVASKLGAKHVVGFDIDEWSVDNANHNAKLNDIDNMDVLLGNAEILNGVDERFDVVVANINRNIIISDLAQYTKRMTDKAVLILSGFYQHDIDIIQTEALKYDLQLTGCNTEDDWACIVLTK